VNQRIESTLSHCATEKKGIAAVDPQHVDIFEDMPQAVTDAKVMPEIELFDLQTQLMERLRLSCQPISPSSWQIVECVEYESSASSCAD
jgi:predicted RNA-binding protein with PUA-like domain